MSTFVNDLKYSIRQLVKNPLFTLVVILTLTLGIGVNSAIFSVVNAVLLRPLPFEDPDRLVMVWQTDESEGNLRHKVSYPNFQDWCDDGRVFKGLAAYWPGETVLTSPEGARKIATVQVTPSFFSVLGLSPTLGRCFTSDTPSPQKNVVLSHAFWKGPYHGDPEIVGKTIHLDSGAQRVIGVLQPVSMPDRALEKAEVWSLLDPTGDMFTQRSTYTLSVLGRLQEGVSLHHARIHMQALGKRLAQSHEDNQGMGIFVTGLHENTVLNVGSVLWILFGAVGFVLLLACANAANLLILRAGTRRREFAIRTALGADRLRLIRQTLTESCFLALISGVVSLGLASWAIDFIRTLVPHGLPRQQDIALDVGVVCFTMLTAALTGIVFGLAPALNSAGVRAYDTLKDCIHSTTGKRRLRLRSSLVVGQIALAMILLIGAGLLMRSFWDLTHVKTGFNSQHVLTWEISLRGPEYGNKVSKQSFFNQLIERLQGTDGVQAVGATTNLPFGGKMNVPIQRKNGPADKRGQYLIARYSSVTTEYFQAMGIPLQAGRPFNASDLNKTKGSVIISETMARLHFADEDPLGKVIHCGMKLDQSDFGDYEIIGIVGDTKQSGFDSDIRPEIFLPFFQQTWNRMTFAACVNGDPRAYANMIRPLVSQLDTQVVVDRIQTMGQWQADSVAQRRFVLILFVLFAGMALCLTVVGVYGVMAYATRQRTQEIGIRMALGAPSPNIAFMILRSGFKLSTAGISIGIIGAIGLSRTLDSLLFELSSTDPVTYCAVALFLLSVSLFACYIPARRAAKTDPVEALRYE